MDSAFQSKIDEVYHDKLFLQTNLLDSFNGFAWYQCQHSYTCEKDISMCKNSMFIGRMSDSVCNYHISEPLTLEKCKMIITIFALVINLLIALHRRQRNKLQKTNSLFHSWYVCTTSNPRKRNITASDVDLHEGKETWKEQLQCVPLKRKVEKLEVTELIFDLWSPL